MYINYKGHFQKEQYTSFVQNQANMLVYVPARSDVRIVKVMNVCVCVSKTCLNEISVKIKE